MMSAHRVGLAQGTAIYVGAILGAGVLALPALAAKQAGPASLVAWVALIVFCVPVAASFAALGARYPDRGGVATFAAKAFGPRASAVVGYWFYFALPAGAPATAYVGGEYAAQALGGGQREALTIGAVLLLAAFASNVVGLRLSGRVQLILVSLLAALLLAAVAAALPDARTANMAPFAPHGWLPVGHAASLLFFSFAGWEAVTHLSGDFRGPQRDLPRVTMLTLAVIAVLYLGLAVTSVLVLGPGLPGATAPLALLLQRGVGSAVSAVTAVIAVLLTFGTMNAYLAGASRLGAALARDGALPAWLAKGHAVGDTPRRSLSLLFVLSSAVAVVAPVAGFQLSGVLLAASACFIAVTVAGLVSGTRLLPRRTAIWWGTVLAAGIMAVILMFSGYALALPVLLAGAALGYGRQAARRQARRYASDPEPLERAAGAARLSRSGD